MRRVLPPAMLLVFLTAGVVGAGEMSRQAFIAEVLRHTMLVGHEVNSESDLVNAQISKSLAKLGPTILPQMIAGPTTRAITSLASQPLHIEFMDQRYIDLAVQEHLTRLQVGIVCAIKYPPPAEEKQLALNRNIDQILQAAETSLNDNVAGDPPFYSPTEIRRHVKSIAEYLSKVADDPTSFACKSPMRDDQVQSIIHDFDKRIQGAQARLSLRLRDPIVRKLTGDELNREEEGIREASFSEIGSWLEGSILDATTDTVRQKNLIKEIPSSYFQIRTELISRVKELKISHTGGEALR